MRAFEILQNPASSSFDYGRTLGVRMQFFIKIVAVEFDGPAADAQLVLDLFYRVAIGQELQDF